MVLAARRSKLKGSYTLRMVLLGQNFAEGISEEVTEEIRGGGNEGGGENMLHPHKQNPLDLLISQRCENNKFQHGSQLAQLNPCTVQIY